MRKRTELYLMRYGITNILRSLPKSIALVCAAMVLTLSICIISQSIVSQTQSLEDVYSEYIIETVITDQFCIEETNLAMNSKYYNIISQNLHGIRDYITDIKIRSSFSSNYTYMFDDKVERELGGSVVGLTYLPDEEEFKHEFNLMPLYDESILLDSRPSCIVPKRMMEDMGWEYYTVRLRYDADEENEFVEFNIVGTHEGPDNIYCSYESFNDELTKGTVSIYSFRFNLINSKFTGEVAKILKFYFIEPSIVGAIRRDLNELKILFRYAFVMPKGNLDDVVKPIESDIRKLKIAEPFLFVLSVATGLVVSFMSTKNRKAEFAVMRSLGTGKAMVFFEAFFEQLLLCLTGMLLGIAVFFAIYRQNAVLVVWKVAVFFVCYMSGTAISVLNVALVNVMKIMKANE